MKRSARRRLLSAHVKACEADLIYVVALLAGLDSMSSRVTHQEGLEGEGE